MAWPRKGVVIRLMIYIPVIGYLGYQAVQKWKSEQETTETAPAAETDSKLDPYKRVIEMPDGSKQEIIELTEEQAEQYLGRPIPTPPKDGKSAE